MKTGNLFIFISLVLTTLSAGYPEKAKAELQKDTITMYTTSEVRSISIKLVEEYKKLQPSRFIDVKMVNHSGFREAMNQNNVIGIIAQRPDVSMVSESMWRMTLGRSVVVTVMNTKNPLSENVDYTGISPQRLAVVLSGNQPKKWGSVLGNEKKEAVHFYIQNDPVIKLSISKFLEISPSAITEVQSISAEELIKTVKNDPFAIAFCQLSLVADFNQHTFLNEVKLVPLDRNGNERLDYNENIYSKLTDFERAVWIGKYPRMLISNVYAVANNFPENENIIEFLSWAVTSGQQFVEGNGFTDLVYNEKQSHLNKLNAPVLLAEKSTTGKSKAQLYLIFAFTILLFGTLVTIFNRKKGKAFRVVHNTANHQKKLNENTLEIPDGLFYDITHTWVFMEKDGTVKMGVDDFMQHVAGDFTGVIMKKPGERIIKNELVLTLVQKGKKINLYSPISATIKEYNKDLVTFPSLINNSPYSWGWVYAMEPVNWFREIRFLKMAKPYKDWIKMEFHRLKDFIARVYSDPTFSTQVVYQEGGELPDKVLQEFGPIVWEDFQKEFLD